MPSSFRPTRLLLCALTLAALSGCASTAPRLLDPPKDPPPAPPIACLRDHPDQLTELDDAYLERKDEEKARDELRRKADDGERYGALLRDHRACKAWWEKLNSN